MIVRSGGFISIYLKHTWYIELDEYIWLDFAFDILVFLWMKCVEVSDIQINKQVLDGTCIAWHWRKYRANKYFSAKLFMTNHFATAQIFNSETK